MSEVMGGRRYAAASTRSAQPCNNCGGRPNTYRTENEFRTAKDEEGRLIFETDGQVRRIYIVRYRIACGKGCESGPLRSSPAEAVAGWNDGIRNG